MQRRYDRTRMATVAFGTALVVASLVPGSGAPSPDPFAIGLDKVAHAGGFFVLTVLAVRGVNARETVVAVAVVLVVLGGGIEVAQTAIPGRTFEVADFVADFVGVVAGLALHRWLER